MSFKDRRTGTWERIKLILSIKKKTDFSRNKQFYEVLGVSS